MAVVESDLAAGEKKRLGLVDEAVESKASIVPGMRANR